MMVECSTAAYHHRVTAATTPAAHLDRRGRVQRSDGLGLRVEALVRGQGHHFGHAVIIIIFLDDLDFVADFLYCDALSYIILRI